MVLGAFGGSLGLLLGALVGLLGAPLAVQIDPEGLTRSDPFALWAMLNRCLSIIITSCASSFFAVVVSLLLDPLRVDVERPR